MASLAGRFGANVDISLTVEHVKARLQVQYAAEKSKRLYRGPVDCVKQLVSYIMATGVRQRHAC